MIVRKIKKEGTVNNIYAAYEDKRISILREFGKSSAPEKDV